MSLPPIVVSTLQSAVIAAFSNVLAQFITAQQNDKTLVIDWVPVAQFFIYAALNTPPNFLWQGFLEESFPAFKVAPTQDAIASAGAGDEKELDREAKEGRLVEPKLDIRNTIIKTCLDQTIGAWYNTVAFSLFMGSLKAAMAHRALTAYGDPSDSLAFLLSGQALDYSQVNWQAVVAKCRAEFVPIVLAGYAFWPWVSIMNFAFVKTVQTRNLVGSLAGVAWGVYMSLFSAR